MTADAAARCRRQRKPRLDDVGAALQTSPLAETRVLEIDASSLAGLSECGYYDGQRNVKFSQKMAHAFKGRLQWCSRERNEAEKEIERWAKTTGRDAHAETVRRFNCTGTDLSEHASINLKPRHYLHEPEGGAPRWMRWRPTPQWLNPPGWEWPDAEESTATCAQLSALTTT